MHPGTCFSCNNGSQEVYAKVGDTEWDGTIYLCETCTIAIMTVFDSLMIPANEQTLRAEILRLEGTIRQQSASLKKLRKLNESFVDVFRTTGIAVPGTNGSGRVPSQVSVAVPKPIVTTVAGINVGVSGQPSESERPEPDNFDELLRSSVNLKPADTAKLDEPVASSAGSTGKSTARSGRTGGTSSGRSVSSGDLGSI